MFRKHALSKLALWILARKLRHLRIEPATRWYEQRFSIGKSGDAAPVEITELVAQAIAWLPEHLRDHVRSVQRWCVCEAGSAK